MSVTVDITLRTGEGVPADIVLRSSPVTVTSISSDIFLYVSEAVLQDVILRPLGTLIEAEPPPPASSGQGLNIYMTYYARKTRS